MVQRGQERLLTVRERGQLYIDWHYAVEEMSKRHWPDGNFAKHWINREWDLGLLPGSSVHQLTFPPAPEWERGFSVKVG